MKSLVAVEIHNNSLRVAEIHNPMSKNPKVVQAHTIDLPPNLAGESLINEDDSFSEILQETWKAEGFKTKDVVIAVSGRRFIARNHVTSQTDLKTFKENIRYDTSAVVPDSMTDPIIDFYPTHYSKDKASIKTHGLVVATPSEPIERIIGAFIKAGLTVRFVDFGPMCIARFLNNYTNDDDYAVVNIREFSSDIFVVKDNIVRIVRIVPNGLSLPTKKRGKRVKEVSQSLNDDDFMVQQSPLERLSSDILVTLESQIDDLDSGIEKLYITGNSSHEEKTLETLHSLLGDSVKLIPLEFPQNLNKNNIDDDDLDANFVSICAGFRNKK